MFLEAERVRLADGLIEVDMGSRERRSQDFRFIVLTQPDSTLSPLPSLHHL